MNNELLDNYKIEKKYLAIIPARGGSKRLPNKNILKIGSHPLIAFSLNSAKALSSKIDHIFSTDCQNIRDIALSYGAYSPFIRPASISSDNITNYEVMKHAINYLEQEKGIIHDAYILLQPTSPFRNSYDILSSIKHFEKGKCPTLASVVGPFSKRHTILKKKSDLNQEELINIGDGTPFYIYNASIYIVSREFFLLEKRIHSSPETFYVMNEYAIDIDTKEDYEMAKMVYSSGLFQLDPFTNKSSQNNIQ